jgi:hypothetical protein
MDRPGEMLVVPLEAELPPNAIVRVNQPGSLVRRMMHMLMWKASENLQAPCPVAALLSTTSQPHCLTVHLHENCRGKPIGESLGAGRCNHIH